MGNLKLSLFTDNMIIYIENSEENSTQVTLEVINEFNKVTGYIRSVHKKQLYFHILGNSNLKVNLRKQFIVYKTIYVYNNIKNIY